MSSCAAVCSCALPRPVSLSQAGTDVATDSDSAFFFTPLQPQPPLAQVMTSQSGVRRRGTAAWRSTIAGPSNVRPLANGAVPLAPSVPTPLLPRAPVLHIGPLDDDDDDAYAIAPAASPMPSSSSAPPTAAVPPTASWRQATSRPSSPAGANKRKRAPASGKKKKRRT
jgi:hypothetical protein